MLAITISNEILWGSIRGQILPVTQILLRANFTRGEANDKAREAESLLAPFSQHPREKIQQFGIIE